MKTKLAILALTVLAGAGATQVLAGPDWLYYPHAVAPKVTPPAKTAAKSCCENRTVVTPPSSGKGVNVSQQNAVQDATCRQALRCHGAQALSQLHPDRPPGL